MHLSNGFLVAKSAIFDQKLPGGTREIALLRAVPRTASVRTLVPCTLLSLQRRQFELLLQHAPQLRARMEAVHSARLSPLTA